MGSSHFDAQVDGLVKSEQNLPTKKQAETGARCQQFVEADAKGEEDVLKLMPKQGDHPSLNILDDAETKICAYSYNRQG